MAILTPVAEGLQHSKHKNLIWLDYREKLAFNWKKEEFCLAYPQYVGEICQCVNIWTEHELAGK